MEACTEETPHSKTLTTEFSNKPQGEEKFFNANIAELEADAKKGF